VEFIRIISWLAIFYLFSSLYKISIQLLVLAVGFICISFLIKRIEVGKRLTRLGVLAICTGVVVIGLLLISTLSFLVDQAEGFKVAAIEQEVLVYIVVFGFYALASFLVEKFPRLALIEAFFLGLWTLRLLEFHRGLNLVSSKFIHQVAKSFGTSELKAFLGIAFTIGVVLILSSLYFSARKSLRPAFIYGLLGALLFIGGFYILNWHYSSTDGKLSSGVGFETEPGVSPLNFDSAVGASPQATALVQLTTSYIDQRTSPLLYFRESALSKLSGKVLVISDVERDFSRMSPRHEFEASETFNTYFRKKVEARSFLLIEHSVPFAIDYPIKIIPIPNPNSEKFIGGAFSAISLAPQFRNDQLTNFEIGNPEWPEDIRNMYLELPNDPRYTKLALEITREAQSDIEKISAVIRFLNKNIIYTLKPNTPKTDDPVATFLFNSRRGYCVHLSHAAVYLFRALGIPSRIGVGYATDLSQSRDGYILLRMNDRHAWPEVYFNGLGWLVFDSFPEQVESHAEAPVDQEFLKSLIEELEKNSPSEATIEASEDRKDFNNLIFWLVGSLIVLLYGIKFYLWFGFKLKRSRYRLALSVLSRLYDQGFKRESAEPLALFLSRLDSKDGSLETDILELFFGQDVKLDKIATYKKISLCSLFSLNSVFRYLFIRTW